MPCRVAAFGRTTSISSNHHAPPGGTLALSVALQSYYSAFEKYPTGTDVQIFNALRGKNPRNFVFFDVGSRGVGTNGELLDPWKTPYRIEFIAQTNFVIRSAGPDQKFGDKDDIVFDGSKSDFVKP